MTFALPLWFWALAVLPLLAVLFLRNERRRSVLLRRLVAARLLERLAGSVSAGKRRARFSLLLLGLAFTIVSLAQPRYGETWEEAQRRGRDVLLAIDTSRSMLAEDLAPNRLKRAKLAAQDLIGQLEGDRVGLIAFAGTAFLQAPLTADYHAVFTSLNELDTEIIPQGGTNIADAIKAAVDAFGKGESEHRALIIFTDGEELDADGIVAAERVKDSIRIFTVGLGSTDGTLIPLPRQGGAQEFVQDRDGQFVKSRLDEDRLRRIAEEAGGFYVHLLAGPAEMTQIVRDGLGAMTETDIDAKLSRKPIERYQWPLAAGLVCLVASMLIGERKRTAVRAATSPRKPTAVAALLALLFPLLAEAKNSGVVAYEKSDFKGALEAFARQLRRMPDEEALHFNLGAAAYKEGKLDQALEAFARAVTTDDPALREKAEYNIGNTLFQRGVARKERDAKLTEWRGALQHYEEALKVDPKDEDTTYNRDLVKKMIEELEKEPPQQQQQQQRKKDKQDKQDKKDGDQKQDQQQSQGDEQKDGEPQEQKDGDEKKEQNAGGKKDEQQAGKDGEKKEEPGSDGEKKEDKEGEGKEPKDAPEQPDKKKEGELKAAPQYEKGENDPAQQEAADAAAAAEGKMTEQQAIALLESLKAEDDRVQLREKTDRKMKERFLRDW
jgi:Ca-activated chloride channel family protein